MAKLDGKRVVVIGGASGVGFAVAQAALAAGAEVRVGSSQTPRIEAAAQRLGEGALGYTVDVKDEASVAAFFDWVGPFDHLVFTAGDWGHMFSSTRELDIEASKARLEVRFWGAARAAKHAVRQIAADGSITLTGGMLAHRPMPGTPLTTASAHTTEGLAIGLARDLAPIRANAAALGSSSASKSKACPTAWSKPSPRICLCPGADPVKRRRKPTSTSCAPPM